MPHRKPSTLGTATLAVVISALVIPGLIIVAHDTLPRRLPWTVAPHD